jgi:hypothetical protein
LNIIPGPVPGTLGILHCFKGSRNRFEKEVTRHSVT